MISSSYNYNVITNSNSGPFHFVISKLHCMYYMYM